MIVVVALLIAAENAHVALWPGYVDDAAVEGLRPASEVRAALRAIEPRLAACAQPDVASELVVDVELLAAGFVDRITPLSASPDDDGDACVSTALRGISLHDRGKEPATHVIARVAFTVDDAPPSSTAPRTLANALTPARDDVDRCVANALAHTDVGGVGSVFLRMKLDARGTLVDVDATEGTLRNDDARVCIAERLRALHVEHATSSTAVYVLRFDKPKRRVQRHTSGFLDKPTLFDVLGCGSAFH